MIDLDVDVVIPAHQAEQTVVTAVRSALAQRIRPRSVVVVADTCVDGTARVARETGAKVVPVEVGTPGAARNVGAREGCATFIAFLDADDHWQPTWLEAVALARQQASTSGVFYGSVEECLPTGALLVRPERRMPAGRVRDALLTSGFVTTSAVVVRRDAFSAVGGFDETLHQVEDLDLWLRLAETYEFTPVRGHHVTYVRTTTSAIHNRAHWPRIHEQHLHVVETAIARSRAGATLRRRAVAFVHKMSARRLLAAGAARAALTYAARSFCEWPLDPELWAMAALALQPAPVRATIIAARRRLLQRSGLQDRVWRRS